MKSKVKGSHERVYEKWNRVQMVGNMRKRYSRTGTDMKRFKRFSRPAHSGRLNIAYVQGDTDVDKGNLRKSIFLCWTKEKFEVLSSEFSDFEIGDKTFEIRGKTKGKHQLRGADNGYIVEDNIEYVCGVKIFLYGCLVSSID